MRFSLLLFSLLLLLACRTSAFVHVLYSSGQTLNGFIGQPSVAAGYCASQPEFTTFQCTSTLPLLAYSGAYPNDAGGNALGLPGTSVNAPVYASDGKTLLFDNLTTLYSNTVEPYVSLLKAGVVNSDFWAFVPNGTNANCQDWSMVESCSSALIKNPSNWTVTIPSFCQVPHAMLCVCVNGQLVTSTPTLFPTLEPTHLPTLPPTKIPTYTPTTAAPTPLSCSGGQTPYLDFYCCPYACQDYSSYGVIWSCPIQNPYYQTDLCSNNVLCLNQPYQSCCDNQCWDVVATYGGSYTNNYGPFATRELCTLQCPAGQFNYQDIYCCPYSNTPYIPSTGNAWSCENSGALFRKDDCTGDYVCSVAPYSYGCCNGNCATESSFEFFPNAQQCVYIPPLLQTQAQPG